MKPNSRVLRILQAAGGGSSNPARTSFSSTLLLQLDDLTELSLAACAFKDRGLLPVLETLRHLPNLRTLVLASNDLTNDGVEWLAHALSLSPAGFEVIAATSAVGANVPAVELRAMFVCPALKSIDLSNNKIGLGGTRLLSDLARLRTSLHEVKIDGVKIEASERRRLDRFLESNRSEVV
jgi:Ran GTPase-activating protein (RanGAP) involved in mRNA processing and transport